MYVSALYWVTGEPHVESIPDHSGGTVLTSNRDNDISPPVARRRDHEEGRHPLLYGRKHLLQESRGEHPEAAGKGEKAERDKCWTDRKGEEAIVMLGNGVPGVSSMELSRSWAV